VTIATGISKQTVFYTTIEFNSQSPIHPQRNLTGYSSGGQDEQKATRNPTLQKCLITWIFRQLIKPGQWRWNFIFVD